MKRIEEIIAGVSFHSSMTSEELRCAKTGLREGWAHAIKELKDSKMNASAAEWLDREVNDDQSKPRWDFTWFRENSTEFLSTIDAYFGKMRRPIKRSKYWEICVKCDRAVRIHKPCPRCQPHDHSTNL